MKKVLAALVLGMLATSAQAIAVSTGVAVASMAATNAAHNASETSQMADEDPQSTYDGKFHCEPKDVPYMKSMFSKGNTFEESFEEAKQKCLLEMREFGITGKFEGFTIRPVRESGRFFNYKFLMRFSIDNYEQVK